MNTEVPYMISVINLTKILDSIQHAGAPDAFGLDFLKDLGFTSSSDRPVIKLLKYLGFLDSTGKPLSAYREFMDGSRAKTVLGLRLRIAYDDLFTSDKQAQSQSADRLKGWFKTKTGVSDSVAKKMATTFKCLATYATFDEIVPMLEEPEDEPQKPEGAARGASNQREDTPSLTGLNFAYRIEVHLPDTTNIDTYRAIFKALKEELG